MKRIVLVLFAVCLGLCVSCGKDYTTVGSKDSEVLVDIPNKYKYTTTDYVELSFIENFMKQVGETAYSCYTDKKNTAMILALRTKIQEKYQSMTAKQIVYQLWQSAMRSGSDDPQIDVKLLSEMLYKEESTGKSEMSVSAKINGNECYVCQVPAYQLTYNYNTIALIHDKVLYFFVVYSTQLDGGDKLPIKVRNSIRIRGQKLTKGMAYLKK
jgi:L-rhamnose mutarotase